MAKSASVDSMTRLHMASQCRIISAAQTASVLKGGSIKQFAGRPFELHLRSEPGQEGLPELPQAALLRVCLMPCLRCG